MLPTFLIPLEKICKYLADLMRFEIYLLDVIKIFIKCLYFQELNRFGIHFVNIIKFFGKCLCFEDLKRFGIDLNDRFVKIYITFTYVIQISLFIDYKT